MSTPTAQDNRRSGRHQYEGLHAGMCVFYIIMYMVVHYDLSLLQYMANMDERPAYLGGKDNTWRQLNLTCKSHYYRGTPHKGHP